MLIQHSITSVWLSATALVLINVVALRCVWLVVGLVTVCEWVKYLSVQRCCKYQSHKYKCKYLKVTIKYNPSTGTGMSLIKNQTAP